MKRFFVPITLFILSYMTIMSLIIDFKLLVHIQDLLDGLNIFNLVGFIFLFFYIFITCINTVFLLTPKTSIRYQSISLYNSVFCLLSGFGLQISNYTLVDDIGPDLSIGFTYYKYHGYGVITHYDPYNIILKLLKADPDGVGYGFIINLIMFSFSLYLFIFYKRLLNGKFEILNGVKS